MHIEGCQKGRQTEACFKSVVTQNELKETRIEKDVAGPKEQVFVGNHGRSKVVYESRMRNRASNSL